MSLHDVKEYAMQLLAAYESNQFESTENMKREELQKIKVKPKRNTVLQLDSKSDTLSVETAFSNCAGYFNFGPCLTKTDRILEWFRLLSSFQQVQAEKRGKRPVFTASFKKRFMKQSYASLVLFQRKLKCKTHHVRKQALHLAVTTIQEDKQVI